MPKLTDYFNIESLEKSRLFYLIEAKCDFFTTNSRIYFLLLLDLIRPENSGSSYDERILNILNKT